MYIIRYPQKGRFAPEGVVAEWAQKEGQSVKAGEVLLRIEAAGELLEVESAGGGVLLKVLSGVGSYVRSGDALAVTGKKGADVSKAMAKLAEAKAPAAKSAPPAKAQAKPTAPKKTEKPTETKKEDVMPSQQTTGNPDNVTPILMPQAGQSMEEGTILSWKVKEGDTIEVGQVIMEIETDKATMEVEATDAGTIAKIISAEGDIVEVKKPVAFIADNAADVDAYLGTSGGTSAPAAPAP